ncbi:MAG: phytoene/squalene synthase family protein [Candidatus Bipolaricaulota bacterium]|nr:phytoene/squalene synthase family protein [Candidatus Bipolaricaulota bacterium]
MDLNAAYAECARITRRQARNFYFAFLSLPRRQRLAVYALYAFCRELDDVADTVANDAPSDVRHSLTENRGATAVLSDGIASPTGSLKEKRGEAALLSGMSGSIDSRRAGIAALRRRLAGAAAGDPEKDRDLALADVIARYGVDPDDLTQILDGVEMDLDLAWVETDVQLEAYAYRVASAVGLATLPILTDGVPSTDAMREKAVSLGLGMQFVNVLRDVDEDLGRGRIYLPRETFAHYGVDEASFRGRAMTPELSALLRAHAERSRALLDDGLELVPLVPRAGRPCLWLLAEIYGRILERIEASDLDVFAGRVSLPTREKLSLLAMALVRRFGT